MPKFYQREIITDLERKAVRFILLRNANWTNAIDGIANEKRLGLVFEYIERHYRPDRFIGDNELWVRK